MNNSEFLSILQQSFVRFLETDSRSNEKLKILHGAIAEDLANRLGSEYVVQSLGYGSKKEGKIEGGYIDKNVDITVLKGNQVIAGIGVKFVMQNYAQNANNYFENMLGETANIQSRDIPYFQIFIIPNQLPYYKKTGIFSKWEHFNMHNIEKYKNLSNDNCVDCVHIPAKTLLCIVQLPDIEQPRNKADYVSQYLGLNQQNNLNLTLFETGESFGNRLVCNDYEEFMIQITYRILGRIV